MRYIATIDAGRSNLHAAIYTYILGTRRTPERVIDLPNIKNEPFLSARDGLLTERVDEVYGAVKAVLHTLPQDVKENMGAIVIDSHGAAAYVLDKNGNPLFSQVYDHDVSDFRKTFHRICGTQDKLYQETSTPALPLGINWLLQIAYLSSKFRRDMDSAAHITSVAGYIASRLTGIISTDITHVANHGYGVDWRTMELSSAIDNLSKRFPEVPIGKLLGKINRKPYNPISALGENDYKINPDCKIISIAHDSSLAAVLSQIAGFEIMDSSGTWSVLMSPGNQIHVETYMQQWDFTVNADIFGKQLPTAMFRGGQMWQGYMERVNKKSDFDPAFDLELLKEILRNEINIRPAYMNGAGPYRHKGTTPRLSRDLLQDPEKLAHAVQLSLALQTIFAAEATQWNIPENSSIVDILGNARGIRMLVAGPYTRGLARDVLSLVNPNGTYIIEDKTPVNLAGALVGVAALEGVTPDKLQISDLPIKDVTPQRDKQLEQLIEKYAEQWEKWVRGMPD